MLSTLGMSGSTRGPITQADPAPWDATGAWRQDAVLSGVLSQLNREVSPSQWARAVLPILTRGLQADAGAVFRATSEAEAEVLAAYGTTRKRGYPYPPLNLLDPALAAITQRPAIQELRGPQCGAMQTSLQAVSHPRSQIVCLASAFMGHRLGGMVVLSRRRPAVLCEEERTCLAGAADAIGLALGTATLSQQSSMSEAVLETACVVARAISGSLDLSRTFRQIAYSAARVMGDCNCLLLESDNDDSDLVAVACSDPADDVLLGLRVRFADAASNREALAERRSIVVEDIVWGAGADRTFRNRLEIRSALFVPIHSENRLIGSLLLYSTERRDRYSERDVAQAEAVAEQAASAICNARLYRDLERSEQRAKDLLERITHLRQRQRLTVANVLHDDIVQTIVAALYQVEDLRAKADNPRVDLDRIAALLKQTIAEARRVIGDLRPFVLDGLGLDRALEALVKRIMDDDASLVESHIEDLGSLSPGISTALYTIAREALQNVRKHARATHCLLDLRRTVETVSGRAGVRLVVMDNGVGFDENAPEYRNHFGLTMMDEQAALVGGSMLVHSKPGQTSIEVFVPTPQVDSRE